MYSTCWLTQSQLIAGGNVHPTIKIVGIHIATVSVNVVLSRGFSASMDEIDAMAQAFTEGSDLFSSHHIRLGAKGHVVVNFALTGVEYDEVAKSYPPLSEDAKACITATFGDDVPFAPNELL